MEIIKDIRNELFKRRELVLEVESDKNPGFQETKKKISEELGISEENADVYGIKGSFGSHKFIVKVNIYDSKEILDNMKKLEVTRKQRKENSKAESKEEKLG